MLEVSGLVSRPQHVPSIQARAVVDVQFLSATANWARPDRRPARMIEIAARQCVLNTRGKVTHPVGHVLETLVFVSQLYFQSESLRTSKCILFYASVPEPPRE